MARTGFSTSNYLEASVQSISAVPLTIAAWFNSNAASTAQAIYWVNNNNSLANGWGLQVRANNALGAFSDDNGTSTEANSAINPSINAWHHGCAVFTSNTLRAIYLDGGNSGTDTTANTPATGAYNDTLGVQLSPSLGNPFSGSLADVAVWNVALDATEIAQLAAGVPAYLIRPQNLVRYYPLDGISPAGQDMSGNWQSLALTGSLAYAADPPFLQRQQSNEWFDRAIQAAGGANTPPWFPMDFYDAVASPPIRAVAY